MNTFAAGAPTDAALKAGKEGTLVLNPLVIGCLISGLNKVLMNVMLSAFHNDSSRKFHKYLSITICLVRICDYLPGGQHQFPAETAPG